jgi:hypothetical protein
MAAFHYRPKVLECVGIHQKIAGGREAKRARGTELANFLSSSTVTVPSRRTALGPLKWLPQAQKKLAGFLAGPANGYKRNILY